MKAYGTLLMLLFIFTSANGQKNLYEVLGLQVEPFDVSYNSENTKPKSEIAFIAEGPAMANPTEVIKPEPVDEDLRAILLSMSNEIKKIASSEKKNSELKIIQHDEDGFIAYDGRFCNYYSGKRNKKRFKGEYFHIKKLKGGRFKVKTIEGYHIINEKEKMIVTGDNHYLKQVVFEDKLIYTCSDINPETKNSRSYTYLENEKVKFLSESFQREDIIYYDEQYLITSDCIVDHQKQLQYLGDYPITYRIVSKDPVLFSAGKSTQNQPVYLIDLDRKLQSENKFRRIEKFDEYNHAIVERYSPIGRSDEFGIIGLDGEWILEPIYKDIKKLGDIYLCYSYKEDKTTVFEKDLKTVRTTLDFGLTRSYKDLLVRTDFDNGKTTVAVYDTLSLTPIKTNLPYDRIRTTFYCGKQHYLVTKRKRKQLLNENFEPILDTFYDNIYTNRNIVGFSKLKDFIFANDGKNSVTNSSFETCGDIEWNKDSTPPNDSFVISLNKIHNDRVAICYDNGQSFIQLENEKFKEVDKEAGRINYMSPLNCNEMCVIDSNGLKGIIDNNGNLILKPSLKFIYPFRDYQNYTQLITSNGDTYHLHRDGSILLDATVPNLKLLSDELSYYRDDKVTTIYKKDKSVLMSNSKLYIHSKDGIIKVRQPEADGITLDRLGKPIK